MSEMWENNNKIVKMMVIMRGLPGSGKSYRANQLIQGIEEGSVICSTDYIWETKPFGYFWIPEFVGVAHKINQAKAREACKKGFGAVIIDNTNTTFKEIEPYLEIAKENGYVVGIVEPETEWAFDVEECEIRNSHGVPLEVIKKMKDRFEPTDAVFSKIEGYMYA